LKDHRKALLRQLDYEHALFDKYRIWSQKCGDTEFAARCGEIAEKHRENYERIARFLE